jgi:hypothetical protein
MRLRIRDFKSDIARAQRRSGLPACCWLEMLEGRPAVHGNILFPLDGPKAQRDRSEAGSRANPQPWQGIEYAGCTGLEVARPSGTAMLESTGTTRRTPSRCDGRSPTLLGPLGA